MVSIREIQQKIQSEAFDAWCANPRSVIEMCTGSGKTLVAIMAIEAVVKKFPDAKILIIVPTEIIRDRIFPDDFKKFGKSYLLKYCTIECIQTVYKWLNTNWTFVVADECHNYLPGYNKTSYEYFKFFENNVFEYFLGLSATIDESLKLFQNKLGPTVYRYTISQAAKDGVVSAFKFVNYAVSLTEEEDKALKTIQRNYNYYEMLLGGPYEAFRSATSYRVNGTPEQKQWANIFYSLIKKRKALLDKALNKLLVTREIMNLLPDSNGIIFSDCIEEAVKITEGRNDVVVYHSKLKKKERLESIAKLEDERTKIKIISTVKALNEGVSINKLAYGVQRNGNSKPKDTIQQTGRICRFIEGKKPLMFRLYIKGTQDEKWLRSSQKDFDPSSIYWCSSIDELKTIINS